VKPPVHIVDDDEAVRDSLTTLLEAGGHDVRAYASGEAFLDAGNAPWAGCVLLDVAMPGMSGIDVQAEMLRRGITLPVIFLTGHGDIATAVKAVKAGAVDFLQKPVLGQALLARVADALTLDAELSRTSGNAAIVRARFDQLTPRERAVMAHAVAGRQNKEIGRALGISHRTVEIHRGRVMRKMGAASVVELAAMAADCDLGPAAAGRRPDA
jgi:FixJ family two-component response regulator